MRLILSVFDVVRIFGPKRDEVPAGWKTVGILNDLRYTVSYSQNAIRAIKSRRMRWAENVAITGKL
jgi:hypothetical protein